VRRGGVRTEEKCVDFCQICIQAEIKNLTDLCTQAEPLIF